MLYFISRLFVIIIYVYFNTPDGDVFFFFVVYTKKITFDFIRFFFKKKGTANQVTCVFNRPHRFILLCCCYSFFGNVAGPEWS